MSFKTATTIHSGRRVIWQERRDLLVATLEGVTIRITKIRPKTYRYSKTLDLIKGASYHYRVYVDGVSVQPEWGFRRTLRQAKGDGVTQALRIALGIALRIARDFKREAAMKESRPLTRRKPMPSLLTPALTRVSRAALNLSQKDLADKAGLGVSTIADYEREARTPTRASLARIEAAFRSAGMVFTKIHNSEETPCLTTASSTAR